MYVIFQGMNWSEGFLEAVYHKKSDAEKDIRAMGYKKQKSTGLFLNEDSWYRVDHMLNIDRLT